MSNDVVISVPQFDTAELRAIASFEDALALASDAFHGNAVAISDVLSDGFGALKEKDRLLGVKFLIVSYTLSRSKEHFDENGEGQVFATARIVTERNEKLFITDGSAGICKQLSQLAAQGLYGNILVPRGLRVSEYEYTDDKGKRSTARTFYLDTSV